MVRTLNDWAVSVLHVQGELRELRAHHFVPQMLVLDYADLLRSRSSVESEREHQLAGCRDLKRLSSQEGLACWTAFQAKAPKEGSHRLPHVLTSASVADCYAKVRIVDAYGSVNMTDQERGRGEMRVFWEAHRSADIRKLWVVRNDLSRGRMVSEVLASQAVGAPAAPEAAQ